MVEVFAGLGSNIDRERNIVSAVAAIRRRYGPLRCSRVYRSRAVGFRGADFFNMVLSFTTRDSPRQVRRAFQRIEAAHGRTDAAGGQKRADKFAPRTIDIDLILYGDMVADEAALTLPRADIVKYAFVLLPLAEIAPQRTHPVLGRRYDEMWRDFKGERELRVVDLPLDRVGGAHALRASYRRDAPQ